MTCPEESPRDSVCEAAVYSGAMLLMVVLLSLVGSAVGPDPCCLRVSPYHIQALAQRMSQRFQALEFRAQDLRNIFSAFQSVHGNVSTRLRFLEADHAQLHAEVSRINSRLQLLEAEKRIEEYRQRLNLDSDWYNPYRGRRESEHSASEHRVSQNTGVIHTDTVATTSDGNITENLESVISSEMEFSSSDLPLLVNVPMPEVNGRISDVPNGNELDDPVENVDDDSDLENNSAASSALWNSTEDKVAPLPEESTPEISSELSLEVMETFESNEKSDKAPDLEGTQQASGQCCNHNLTASNETETSDNSLMLVDNDLSDAELKEALKDLDRLLSSAPRDVPDENEDPEKALLKRALALALEALDRTSDACLQLVNVTADAFGELTDL